MYTYNHFEYALAPSRASKMSSMEILGDNCRAANGNGARDHNSFLDRRSYIEQYHNRKCCKDEQNQHDGSDNVWVMIDGRSTGICCLIGLK